MFLDLLEALRRREVPVATHEWMALMRGLELGLHGSTVEGFYHLARAVCVKDVAHFDAFDEAFLTVFRGLERVSVALLDQLRAWLEERRRRGELSEEERALLEELSPEQLMELFRRRLAEQRGRHDGGSRWIGTGGTSPFGSGGRHPTGLRIGEAGGRSAMRLAEERRFAEYRRDVVLDVRRIDLALRLLRDLGREGAPSELDLDATVDRTARNAGELDLVMEAPRRNRMKLLLLMDVGGSMDPHAHLVERLFTAASRTGRFARFRHLYFHNCVYDRLYEDAAFLRPLAVSELVATCDRDERLVLVGDAAMHPAELLAGGGAIWSYTASRTPGLEWMRRLAGHFRHAAWLNPDPEETWRFTQTVRVLASLFPMFPLTLDGLDRAVRHLVR